MVWSLLSQPASAAAATSVIMVKKRVMYPRLSQGPCQRQGTCLHCTASSHSFQAMAEDAGTSAQRIRIGLTGLAFAFLLVLLGSVVSRSRDENSPPQAQEQANDAEPIEPLAELGVAPGGDTTANNSQE